MKGIYISLFILALTGSSFAQNQKEYEKWGDMAAEINDHYGAALYYKKALDIDSAQSLLNYKYAEALRGYNDYEKAEHYYYKIYRKDRGRLYPDGPFWLATMMMHNGKYAEAKKIWRKIVSSNRRDKSSYVYLKAEQQMKSCDSALVFIHQRQQLEIENIGEPVNSFDAEFSPVLDENGNLYFGSLKGELGKNNEVIGKQYHIVFYIVSEAYYVCLQHEVLDTWVTSKFIHTGTPAIHQSISIKKYYNSVHNIKTVLKEP